MAVPHIQLMSRRECCLCDEAKAVVDSLSKAGFCSWETVDVDRDKGLMVRYGMDVPVLLVDGREIFRHRVNETGLKDCLQQLAGEVAA